MFFFLVCSTPDDRNWVFVPATEAARLPLIFARMGDGPYSCSRPSFGGAEQEGRR